MSNPNTHESFNRESRQDSYQDANGNTHTNVTHTTETVNTSKAAPQRESYRDGYFHGRVAERSNQEEALTARDNDNAARGLLLGILLTGVVALTAGTIWFFNQQNQEPNSVTQPVVVPVPSNKPDTESSSTVNQTSEKQTIIEKIKEVPIPVPVPQQEPPTTTPQQNTDATTPSPAPEQSEAQQAAPEATEPAQMESQDSASTEDTQTDTSSNTDTNSATEGGSN